jgi:serine/threonine protein kinase
LLWCGQPNYMAPEIARENRVQDDGHPGVYFGMEADLWSLGVLLYKCTLNELPFDGTSKVF